MTELAANESFDRAFAWATRAILMIDIVESVRLVEADEVGAISRWFSFLNKVKTEVIPNFAGRLIKALGDGMLLDFGDVRNAVAAALAIHRVGLDANANYPPDRHMLLRIGIEVGDVIVDGDDVHGRGVHRAARLMALAGPGEIIVSQHVRDRMTLGLDAEIEDLGECFVRHIVQPIRAYRVGPPSVRPAAAYLAQIDYSAPTIAVIPLNPRQCPDEHDILGEAFADEIIRILARSPNLRVISRLSTTAYRARAATLDDIAARLRADYVLSGSYRSNGQRITLTLELAETKSERIVWTDRLIDDVGEILDESSAVAAVVTAICSAIELRELQRARHEPLPTLKAYTLLLGAISLMHRLAPGDFAEARRLLDVLLARGGRQPLALSWLANWHVLRVQQGWSSNPQEDAALALDCTKRALEMDPDCDLAATIEGSVRTSLLRDLDEAMQCYQRAIALSPNQALAWLLKGTLHAFVNEGSQAVEDTQRALKLSPLDPHRYYYESLAATACLADGQHQRALELARSSLQANRQHTSTLRVMTVAQWRLGHKDAARATFSELLRLEPTFSVDAWRQRSPAGRYPMGHEAAEVFRQVGAPN